MDRNSAIGLTLIAVLLLVYFNFFAPEPPKEIIPPVTTESVADSAAVSKSIQKDSITATPTGPLADMMKGEEKTIRVETADLILTFTNVGGILQEVELKKFKTYYKKPLYLVTKNSNEFKLNAQYEGKELDLYSLFYTNETKTLAGAGGDTTRLIFTSTLGEGKSISHIYSIPPAGYIIKYQIASSGLNGSLGGNLSLVWNDNILSQEKDIINSRVKSTINYYTLTGDFDGLSESSSDLETETLTSPVKWIGIKQKFFTSSIIASGKFNGAELTTSANNADTTIIKSARVKLSIPAEDLLGNKASYNFFFGPNDYKVLSDVTVGFSKNLDLGWPPVNWVNKFVIIPIFHFLEGFIGNYGVIIMILVIIIKLILTPLSYSSYLGMAKMRLLKPELDLIKEKNADNATQAQAEQMKLYQQAGVNPFSGCIPLILQMPILFAMFYFFPVSVELRQQPFLWAEDLSTYDSIATLPFTVPFGYGDHVSLFVLLMTASTLIYQWQNNQISSVTGPMKSMSYVMPLIFLFVLNSFSAGLSFYYFISNLVTFAQQAIIKRFVDEDKIKTVMDEHKKKLATGTTKKSKFMSKLEDAMKASEEARKKKS